MMELVSFPPLSIYTLIELELSVHLLYYGVRLYSLSGICTKLEAYIDKPKEI